MAPERTPAPIHPGPESTFVDLLLLGMMPAVMLFGYKGMDALSSWLSGAGVPKSALPHVRYRRRRIAAAAGVVLCLCVLIGSVSFQASAIAWVWEHPTLRDFIDDHFSTASGYYSRQRPLVAAASRHFAVNWYWAQISLTGLSLDTVTYGGLMQRRLGTMVIWDEAGRDDYRLERDQCEMYRFFDRNKLPSAKILQSWDTNKTVAAGVVKYTDDIDAAVESLSSLSSLDERAAQKRWPLRLRACHLSERSEQPVLKIHSASWAKKFERSKIDHWAQRKWRQHTATDEALVRKIRPSFSLLAASPLPDPQSGPLKRGVRSTFEIEMEVLWGRAYLGQLVVNGLPSGILYVHDDKQEGWEMQPVSGIGSIMSLHRYLPRFMSPVYPPHVSWDWIMSEGHVSCAAGLAEQVAKVMAIEHVRVNIALDESDAGACIVDRLLSESHSYSHTRQIAKLWAEGLLAGPRVFGDQHSPPVYMQTLADIPKA